jgi:hypothetical protein
MDQLTKLYYHKSIQLQEQYNTLVKLFEDISKMTDAEIDNWVKGNAANPEQAEAMRETLKAKRAKQQAEKAKTKATKSEPKAPKATKTAEDIARETKAKQWAEQQKAAERANPKPGAASQKPKGSSKSVSTGSEVTNRVKNLGKSIVSSAPALIGFGLGDMAGQVLSNKLGIEGELPREAISSTTAGTGLAAGESIIPAASAAKQAGLRAGASSLIRGTMAAAPVGIGLAGGFAAGEKAAENILDYAGVENETARFAGKSAGGLAGGVPGAAITSGLVGGGKALATGAGLKGAAVAGKAAALAGAAAAAKTAGIGAVAVGGYLLGDYIGDKTGLHKAVGDYLGGADKLTEKPTGVAGGDPAKIAQNAREEQEEEERRREMDKKYIAKSKRKLVEEILEKRKAEKQTTK